MENNKCETWKDNETTVILIHLCGLKIGIETLRPMKWEGTYAASMLKTIMFFFKLNKFMYNVCFILVANRCWV